MKKDKADLSRRIWNMIYQGSAIQTKLRESRDDKQVRSFDYVNDPYGFFKAKARIFTIRVRGNTNEMVSISFYRCTVRNKPRDC